ncbi:MAG TPA: peptidoglycan-binding domain-containing protein, partial [Chthoniobacterales bacterium]
MEPEPSSTEMRRDASARGGPSVVTHKATAAWVFTLILLTFLFSVAFLIPEPTDTQASLFRFFMASFAAFCCYFWVGRLELSGMFFGQRIAAGGGVALFLLMFFFADPRTIRSKAGDYFPTVVVPNDKVQDAQEALRHRGLLNKNPDGIRDTATTQAIKALQAENSLPTTGSLNTPT